MIPLLALKNIPWRYVGAALVIIGVVSYVALLNVRVSKLETMVAEKNLEISQCNTNMETLTSSLVSQNSEIQRWSNIAQQKQDQASDALMEARKQGVRANELVGELKSSRANTCEEGITLLDEALGL